MSLRRYSWDGRTLHLDPVDPFPAVSLVDECFGVLSGGGNSGGGDDGAAAAVVGRGLHSSTFGSTEAHFVGYVGYRIPPLAIRQGDTGGCDQDGLG